MPDSETNPLLGVVCFDISGCGWVMWGPRDCCSAPACSCQPGLMAAFFTQIVGSGETACACSSRPQAHSTRFPLSPLMSSDYVEARVALQRRVRRRRPWLDAAQTPFRDDAPMVGAPGTTAADFEMPRLRCCPFNPDSIVWEARVGGGMDGYVWKVRFGAQGPFVLKAVSGTQSPWSKRNRLAHQPSLVSSFGMPSPSTFPLTMPRSENVRMPPSSK